MRRMETALLNYDGEQAKRKKRCEGEWCSMDVAARRREQKCKNFAGLNYELRKKALGF